VHEVWSECNRLALAGGAFALWSACVGFDLKPPRWGLANCESNTKFHPVRIGIGGHDWAPKFPLIVKAALKLRMKHFVIDGEVGALDKDGISDFHALRSGKHNERAQLYAFDMLAGDGEDHGRLPLSLHRANLARLLSRRGDGIFIAKHERGHIGHDLFRAACRMVSRVSFRSALTTPIVLADAAIGLRRRTPRIWLAAGSGIRSWPPVQEGDHCGRLDFSVS
jgi:hypothetical protein